MQLVLFRHAKRDALTSSDANLNAQGLKQVERLRQALHEDLTLPTPTEIFSSPKLRARQTMQPLADETGIELHVEESLDERSSEESAEEFTERIQAFLELFPSEFSERSVVYVCSHLDWLELALIHLPSSLSDIEASEPFQPGEARVFKLDTDSIWHLVKKFQP